MRTLVLSAICLSLIAAPATAQEEAPTAEASPAGLVAVPQALTSGEPRFALGVNVLNPALYGLGSSAFEGGVYVPFDVDGHFRGNGVWGVAATFEYIHHVDGDFNANGVTVLVGPRLSVSGSGLEGVYGAAKLGVSVRGGEDYFGANYYRIDAVIRPELGYAHSFGTPGVFVAAGVALQLHKPISETEHPGWDWNGLGKMVNYYLPMAVLTVGFGG